MITDKLQQSHDVLLVMMRFALIEIRASENIELSKSLADIFHNIPSLLTLDFDENKRERAFKMLYSKAEKHQMLKYIKSLEDAAEKSLS